MHDSPLKEIVYLVIILILNFPLHKPSENSKAKDHQFVLEQQL